MPPDIQVLVTDADKTPDGDSHSESAAIFVSVDSTLQLGGLHSIFPGTAVHIVPEGAPCGTPPTYPNGGIVNAFGRVIVNAGAPGRCCALTTW